MLTSFLINYFFLFRSNPANVAIAIITCTIAFNTAESPLSVSRGVVTTLDTKPVNPIVNFSNLGFI